MKKLGSVHDGFVSVQFELPAASGASRAAVAGEFTAWNKVEMNPMPDGSFSIRIDLPAGKSYRFRYFVNESVWENDWSADEYVPNPYGGEDSVVVV